MEIVLYDDYNSRIPNNQDVIGSLTTRCGASALREFYKIIEKEEKMVRIVFKFKDEYTHGQWREREGTYKDLEQCISMNGLNEVEHEIISVEEVK